MKSAHLPLLFGIAFGRALPLASAADQPATTSVQVPLSGTVFVPLTDGSTDSVSLSGSVHVLAHVFPPDPVVPGDQPNRVRLRINLDQVSGVGDVSGLQYIATGANRLNFAAYPPDPVNVSFDLGAHPPDPVYPPDPIIPLDISFILEFDPDTGYLTGVTIKSMGVPAPRTPTGGD